MWRTVHIKWLWTAQKTSPASLASRWSYNLSLTTHYFFSLTNGGYPDLFIFTFLKKEQFCWWTYVKKCPYQMMVDSSKTSPASLASRWSYSLSLTIHYFFSLTNKGYPDLFIFTFLKKEQFCWWIYVKNCPYQMMVDSSKNITC